MERLKKYSNFDTAWNVYLVSFSVNDTLKCTVDGYQSVLWDTIIRLQDSISSIVGQHESKTHVVPYIPIGVKMLSSIANAIS